MIREEDQRVQSGQPLILRFTAIASTPEYMTTGTNILNHVNGHAVLATPA
jgi:hypothetical protein